ncbi:MAG TPA: LysR substrate-binding domain-containing protein [Stellaceae bacterium]|nr:LysR substrate-binding domain-containing protein [Stellaceae bacterium]
MAKPTSGFLKRLPRLSSLLMFEAAARCRSFTIAARELSVTQAAVSQQVRALERELGLTLFNRLHRGLELTRDGARLQRAVTSSFAHIAETTSELRAARRSQRLEVGATFAVATFWLVPRLPRFRALHPEIDVHVVASDRGFDAIADQVDAGIAYGLGNWPGFRTTLIREGEVFPVCSPDYIRRRPRLTGVEQLLQETLLSIDDDRPGLMDWGLWFADQDIEGYDGRRNLRMNSHPLLMQAATEGQGIALGWSLLTDDLLEKGKLVRPLDATVRTPKGFYLVSSDQNTGPEVQAFRDWVLQQFEVPGEPATRTRAKLKA